MALTENDERTIRTIFREELEPMKEKVQEIRQTVYGSDGVSGMRRVVNDHGQKIADLQLFQTQAEPTLAVVTDQETKIQGLINFRTQVKTALYTVVPAAQVAIAVFIEWVRSRFHNG